MLDSRLHIRVVFVINLIWQLFLLTVCSRLLDDSFDGIIIKELLHYGDNRRNDVIRPTNGALSLNQWKAARYLAKVLKKTTLEVTGKLFQYL